MPTSRLALHRASPKRSVGAARRRSQSDVQRLLDTNDATLVDVVDNALTKGVVLSGDLTLALAGVDLIYARLSLLLCAADRILPVAGPSRRRRPR